MPRVRTTRLVSKNFKCKTPHALSKSAHCVTKGQYGNVHVASLTKIFFVSYILTVQVFVNKYPARQHELQMSTTEVGFLYRPPGVTRVRSCVAGPLVRIRACAYLLAAFLAFSRVFICKWRSCNGSV